jgi:hypothetical protein
VLGVPIANRASFAESHSAPLGATSRNMPLLTELGTITRQIYKDAAPTALLNSFFIQKIRVHPCLSVVKKNHENRIPPHWHAGAAPAIRHRRRQGFE